MDDLDPAADDRKATSARWSALARVALLAVVVPVTLMVNSIACGPNQRGARSAVLDAAEVLCALEHVLEPQPVIDQLCSIEEQHRDAIHRIVVGVRAKTVGSASASSSASAAPSAPPPPAPVVTVPGRTGRRSLPQQAL